MSHDGSLIFDTRIDSSGFTTSLKSLTKSFKRTALQFVATLGIAFSGKQAIELASDIQEVQNVVDTAFGDMKYKMEAFAESAIEVYGISKLTAKQTGSTFMAMATGMNLASETASNMSLQLTALSADMASFYNKTQEVTSTALKSVFTGETETLKQFGIVMTEANLEAFRLAQGIEKSYRKMSQAEKVALRYNYVMKQTRLAQGDFAKTQDSWANQTRILSERWKEFLSILGSGLVKVLTPVVQVLNTALQYLIDFANVIARLLGWESKEQEAVSNEIGASVENQEALTDATKETAKANKKTLASFDEIQKLTSSSENGNSTSYGSGVSFDVATPYDFDVNTEKIEISLDNIKLKLETIKDYFSEFGKIFVHLENPFKNWIKDDFITYLHQIIETTILILKGLFETISMIFRSIFDTVIMPFLNTLFEYVLPVLTQIATQVLKTVGTLFETIKKIFQILWVGEIEPAFKLIMKIWDSAWQTIHKAWQKLGEPLFENVRTTITNLGEYLQIVWDNFLKPIWNNFMKIIDELWNQHLKPLWDNMLDFIGELINGALEIYNKFISPIVNWLTKILGPVFSSVFNSMMNIAGTVVGVIIDGINGMITTLKGIIQFIVGVFTWDWEKAWEGIGNFFKGIWDNIVNIVKGAINLVIGYINGMISALESGLNMIVNMINTLSFEVPEWVPGIGGQVWGFNIPPVKFGRIPKLATGTVVPANYGEFAAILGDNKREAEVVSPLSTMKQALIEALAESGQNITIKFEESSIGDLVRLLKPYIDKENRRVGSSTRVTGGAY